MRLVGLTAFLVLGYFTIPLITSQGIDIGEILIGIITDRLNITNGSVVDVTISSIMDCCTRQNETIPGNWMECVDIVVTPPSDEGSVDNLDRLRKANIEKHSKALPQNAQTVIAQVVAEVGPRLEEYREVLSTVLSGMGIPESQQALTAFLDSVQRNPNDECDVCQSLGTLADGVLDRTSLVCVLPVAVVGCMARRVGDMSFKASRAFCQGWMLEMTPVIYRLFNTVITQKVSVFNFCQNLNACLPGRTPRATKYRSSNRQVPPALARGRYSRQTPKMDLTGAVKIVQLTDIHMQTMYKEGSYTKCSFSKCCTEKTDAYARGSGSAGRYGDYSCNAAPITTELIMKKASDLDPDFLIYNGDSGPHNEWDETLGSQKNISDIVANMFLTHVPGKRVYPTLGNHDTFPSNTYYYDDSNRRPPLGQIDGFTERLNEAMHESWEPLAGFARAQKNQIEDAAWYTMDSVVPGLKILSYNSNFNWYTLNYYSAANNVTEKRDTLQEAAINFLQEARDNGHKVIVLTHHPLGRDDIICTSSRWWEGVAQEYHDVIVLHATGHGHTDFIRMVYNATDGQPTLPMFTAPSAMPASNPTRPSLRLYYLHNVTFQLLDYEQYVMDIDDGPDQPVPYKLYSAREAYGLQDMSAASWGLLIDRMWEDEAMFQVYYAHNLNGPDEMRPKCTGNCKVDFLCGLQNVNYDMYLDCVDANTIPVTNPPSGVSSLNQHTSTLVVLVLCLTVSWLASKK